MIENEIEKIALIDADSLIYYCSLGNKEYPKTLEEAMTDLDNRIYEMVKQSGCSHYITFVSKGSENFRYKSAVTRPYKGNRPRPEMPPVFIGLRAYLYQKPSYICTIFEADDAVGLFKTGFQEFFNISSVICSPDKDVLRQIEGVHFNYGKNEVINTSKEEAKRFLYTQLLMGDSTDEIVGIPKVGEITAGKFLDEGENYPLICLQKYIDKFGESEGIYKFSENYKLVNILKTNADVVNTCNIELKHLMLGIGECIISNEIIWEEK